MKKKQIKQIKWCILSVMMGITPLFSYAQNPIPEGPGPVIGISAPPQAPVNPPSDNPLPPPPPGPNGQPAPPAPGTPPPGWVNPGTFTTPPSADWMNQGTMNVMATGYDSEGVMKQIPLYISYSFNGVNYNVTVLNAWDPYTQMWNMGVDQPAYSTSYYFNGFTYNFYAPLAIGTFYFNL